MKLEVLDHGYVELIELWGGGKTVRTEQGMEVEAGIIEAARQSTQGSFRGWEEDEKLLEYLFKNGHFTPFEFAGMVIEVQAPIMVFREWHRHRTQSYNEMSARYAPLPDLYYVPTHHRVMEPAGSNKQAQGIAPLDPAQATAWLETLQGVYSNCEAIYKASLEQGIPKELARLVMPVGHYSRMRATANLRNWLQFLNLRMDHRAQWEIRSYANAVGAIMSQVFPKTWKLFGGGTFT